MSKNMLYLEKEILDLTTITKLLEFKKKEKAHCTITLKIQNGNIADVDVTNKYKIFNLAEYLKNKDFTII